MGHIFKYTLRIALNFTIIFSFWLQDPKNSNASFPEFFGASATTTSIGGQSNFDVQDPSNNYYIPSLLAFTNKFHISLGSNSTATHFEPIKNVVVKNPTNSSETEVRSDVSTDYLKYYNYHLHLALPLGMTHFGTLGLSVFGPIGHFIEGDSGNPHTPEYVMYRARYKRTSVFLNFSKSFFQNFAWSLGSYLGYQASANANLNLGLNGTQYGTNGRARTKIDPSLAGLFSLSYRGESFDLGFHYQQEMKSNLSAEANGELSNPVSLPFVSKIDSMLFYDPHILRIGINSKRNTNSPDIISIENYLGLEYQMWSKYTPSKITVTKISGVVEGSRDYENISIRDTWNPKFGSRIFYSDRWKQDFGFSYRMSPLDSDFSGSGNSVDTDTFNYSTGLHYTIKIDDYLLELNTSFLYSDLKKKIVQKSSGREDGSAGNKIGSPGYTIDGKVISGTFGLKLNF